MADDDDVLAAMWTAKLQSVQRLDPDDPEDDEDTFMVEFELQSPGMNGSMSVMVPGGGDDATIIVRAREDLQSGLDKWARIMARAPGAERIKFKEG